MPQINWHIIKHFLTCCKNYEHDSKCDIQMFWTRRANNGDNNVRIISDA